MVAQAITISMPTLPTLAEVETLNNMCKIAAYSNFINSSASINNIAQRAADAFFVMMLGRELGIPPMTSLKTIYVIDGKPTCSGQALLALMRKGGMEVDIPDPATIEESAMIRVRRPGAVEWKTYTYTRQMAIDAGLWGSKKNWKSSPREMMIWRAVSIASRFEASDIVGGLYTIEEINPDIEVDAAGMPLGRIALVSPKSDPDPEPPAGIAEPVTEVVEEKPVASNVTDITERARQTLGSGNPNVPRRIPIETVATDGSSALEPAPEIEQPEESNSPNGTEPTPPSGDVPKDPQPSENEVKLWEYDFQALMKHEDVTALYPQSAHRANVLKLLDSHKAFAKLADIKGATWKVKIYNKFRADGQSEEDAVAATVSAPDPLAGF